MITLRRNVRVSSTRLVVQTIVKAVQAGDVGLDGGCLVTRRGEVIAETGAGAVTLDSDFRLKTLRRSDGRNPRTTGREVGDEHRLRGVGVGEACTITTYTGITRREDDGDTASSQLSEAGAYPLRVRVGHGLLVIAVRGADDLREVGLGESVVKEGQVGLVGVGRRVEVWVERRRAAGGEGGQRCWPSDTEHELSIQIAFVVPIGNDLRSGVITLVVESIRNDYDVELVGGGGGFRAESVEENRNVGPLVRLVQVVRDTDLVLTGNFGLVVDGTVQAANAVWRCESWTSSISDKR